MTAYLTYGYVDASGYKQSGTIRLTEKLTLWQAKMIAATLDEGRYFIPEQVGIPALPYSLNHGEDDHPWHNLSLLAEIVDNAQHHFDHYYKDEYLYTRWPEDTVSDTFTPKLLVNAFMDAAAKGWDEVSY